LAVRRVGWRAFGAAAAAGAIPLAGYVLWFHSHYGRYAFSNSDGIYLWSRTMTFANCSVIQPPAGEQVLCPRQPVAQRPAASTFIWEKNSPLNGVPGPKFSARKNALAMNFALRAIAAQPGSYLADVLRDVSLTFYWNNPDHPSAAMAHRYEFAYATTHWISPGYLLAPGRTVASDQLRYGGGGPPPAGGAVPGRGRACPRFAPPPGARPAGPPLAGAGRGRRRVQAAGRLGRPGPVPLGGVGHAAGGAGDDRRLLRALRLDRDAGDLPGRRARLRPTRPGRARAPGGPPGTRGAAGHGTPG